MKMPKRYYSLIEDSQNDVADLYIFGDITSYGQWGNDDPDRSAYNIVNELKAVAAGAINVHINSYGGDVFEGLAIYNTLRGSGKRVTTYCDGCACSAASVVFMAGTDRIMSPASLLMIHNAWTLAIGNSEELRKQADDLETITQASVEAYKLGASISEDEIKTLMDHETWILPEQAIDWGFATEISEEDEDGVKQSAFHIIMNKLTAPAPRPAYGLDPTAFKAALDKTIERMEELLKPKEENKKHEVPPACGWDLFFAKNKED